MRNLLTIIFCLLFIRAFEQPVAITKEIIRKKITLPNGWSLTPIGNSVKLGDLPLNVVVSPTKKYLAVTNNGQSKQSLQLIDVKTEKVVSSIEIPKSWLGLQFSSDEKYLYASGGNDNRILQYAIVNGKLMLRDSILLGEKWPEKISPAGLDVDSRRKILYVVTKENNSLYVVNLSTKKIIKTLPLGGEGYTCLLSPDKATLYVTCWGCDKVLMLDTKSQEFTGDIAVGDNPNDLCLSKNGAILYVANANDNDVSVIDLKNKKVIETLSAAMYAGSPSGSTTNALALSADDKTLYVANADNNCLAVFDVSNPGSSKSKGFIPTGWYPTSVKVVGHKVYVANGKGFSSMANPHGPNPTSKKENVTYQKGQIKKQIPVQYIGGLFTGTLSIFHEPDEKALSAYSELVFKNSPYVKANELTAQGEQGNPVPMKIGDPSPIKYVFYIIKENRTYDQVLGDIKEGNGDSSLVLFGEKVTPNLHAIARQFVLLDNFYCDAEVSADGHNWSMGGYATDYLEKTWPTSYGDRGGNYDGEGNRAIANNKTGFIWDHCSRAGVSYRTYGEFADDYKPNIPVLKDHFCTYYTSWDQTVRDTTRVNQWKQDFDSLVAAKALPQLNTLRIINDHTEGMRIGRPTPFAHVADNDLAVGRFIEHLSQSPVWNQSVVFIIEDDAQAGPDHVDAHRTTAYIAGGYVKRHLVDHTPYSTTSILHTIELILGIPPMSQYDAAAMPMWRCFSSAPDPAMFSSVPNIISLDDKNVAWNEAAKKSEGFDFTKEDRVPDNLFNEVLWKGIKGAHAIVPAPRRAAFVREVSAKKDADD